MIVFGMAERRFLEESAQFLGGQYGFSCGGIDEREVGMVGVGFLVQGGGVGGRGWWLWVVARRGAGGCGDLDDGVSAGGGEAMEAVIGEEAIGTESGGFGECGGSSVDVGKPEFDVGITSLNGGDDGQFFAVDAGEAEDDGAVSEGSLADFGHSGIGVVEFSGLEAKVLQDGGYRGAAGRTSDNQGSPVWAIQS